MCIKSMDQENKFAQLSYPNWPLNIFKAVDLFKMDQEKFNVFFVVACFNMYLDTIQRYC